MTFTIPKASLTVLERASKASQRTAERVFGVPSRRFLGLLPAFREAGGVVTSIGKLRLVDVDAFAAWIEQLGRDAASSDRERALDGDQRRALEAELGLVVRGPKR